MTTYGLPLFFEDKTGLITHSDFVDIYDRPPFLRFSQTTSPHTPTIVTQIYELGPFIPNQFPRLPAPSAKLEFGTDHRLGTITLRGAPPLAMDAYLRVVRVGGNSLVRKFRASNGVEYMWGFHTVQDQEWSCVNASTLKLVAHYDLKPPGEPQYTTSGNVLTVYEEFQNLSVELLASLIIMRHIAEHGL